MKRDEDRPAGFPWWLVSVVAAGLVFALLVANRPDAPDRVSVRSQRTATARRHAAKTSTPPTSAPAPKRAVAAASRSSRPASTTVAPPTTLPPTTAAAPTI